MAFPALGLLAALLLAAVPAAARGQESTCGDPRIGLPLELSLQESQEERLKRIEDQLKRQQDKIDEQQKKIDQLEKQGSPKKGFALKATFTDGFHLMDQESFETLTLSLEMIGDAQDFLGEGLIVQVHKYKGNPIGLQLPPHVELTIAQTEPGVRGDSSGGNVTKPVTLETGLVVNAPMFIKEGDVIRIDTRDGQYVERASQ